MKRIVLFTCLLLSTLCTFALETKKVAVLEVVDKENKLSYHQKLMLRSRLSEEVNKSVGYETYDRSNIDAILREQDFQRTGLVSSDQIHQLGEMAGVSYILVIEGAVSTQGHLFVSANVLDVESAQILVSASKNMAASEKDLQQGCALLAKELFGKINSITKTSIKAEETEKARYYVSKNKSRYMYMGNIMDKKAYIKFLETNCPDAYKQYMKGTILNKIGWSFLGVGLVVATVGGAEIGLTNARLNQRSSMNPYSPEYKHMSSQADTYNALGWAGVVVGSAIVATSIPLLCIGHAKQKKSMSIYNEQCSSPSVSPITLNVTAGQNGMGVAMRF